VTWIEASQTTREVPSVSKDVGDLISYSRVDWPVVGFYRLSLRRRAISRASCTRAPDYRNSSARAVRVFLRRIAAESRSASARSRAWWYT